MGELKEVQIPARILRTPESLEVMTWVRGECKSCRYWDGSHCRIARPAAYSTTVFRAIGDSIPQNHDVIMTQWPQTEPDDWCGEFKPKPEKGDQ